MKKFINPSWRSFLFLGLFAFLATSVSAQRKTTPRAKPPSKSSARPNNSSSSSSHSSHKPSSYSSSRRNSGSSSYSSSGGYSSSGSSGKSSKSYSSGNSSSSGNKGAYSYYSYGRSGSSSSSGNSSSNSSSSSSSSRSRSYNYSEKKKIEVIKPDLTPDVSSVPATIESSAPEYLQRNSIAEINTITSTLQEDNSNLNHNKTTMNQAVALASGIENNPLTLSTITDDQGKPITVHEAISDLPDSTRKKIVARCNRQLSKPYIRANRKEVEFWTNMRSVFSRPSADICLGKSYGDPHMRTYDGYHYDIQSVGEFVLTKAINSSFEIQSRQSATGSSLSLNTACAMNVNNDRVCIFSQDFPDTYSTMPIRVNGNPLDMTFGSYKLPNGGIIRMEGRNIRVTWPTGEQCLVKFFHSGGKKYMNILPQVFAAHNSGGYVGLLGNADGIKENDLISSNWMEAKTNAITIAQLTGSKKQLRKIKKEVRRYNRKLSRNFIDSWRVTSGSSLFDYTGYTNTNSFTDYSFPRKHHTLAELSPEEIQLAKQTCEDAGITGEDELKGCMYDVSFTKDADLARMIADVDDDQELVRELEVTNELQTTMPSSDQ